MTGNPRTASTAAGLLLLAILAGCGARTTEPGPDAPAAPREWNATYFLKAGYRLDPAPPAKNQPDKVPSNPIVNGFANEDLQSFVSAPLNQSVQIQRARLTVFYQSDGPTVDPFRAGNGSARTFVFWVGSNDTYPTFESTWGDPVLDPSRVYEASAGFALPKPGWIVPANETLQILVATLAVNDPHYDVRFLVDSLSTPSRLELSGTVHELVPHGLLDVHLYPYSVAGNGGLFTGATGTLVPSEVRHPISLGSNGTYGQVGVHFRSNAGGKSDLDLTLLAPDGKTVASSTTPFQSEFIRLFQPNLAALAPGDYIAHVSVYSGVQTQFDVEVSFPYA